MVKLSTGLKSAILGDHGLAQMMDYGVIDIYSGPQPEIPDLAPTGVKLARITTDGGLFVAGSPTNGLALSRETLGALTDSGNWVLTGIAPGAAGWWRWKWYLDDPDTTHSHYPRIDGLVGESLILKNSTIYPATNIPIDSFYLSFTM